MMYENDNQLKSLRAAYRKNLLANIGCAVTSILVGIILLGNQVFALSIEWGIALGLAVVLAAVEYIIERALYQKGKNVSFLPTVFVLGLLAVFVVSLKINLLGAYTHLIYPMLLGFLLVRPLIPAVGLLRDLGRLRTGDLCETVGRMKKDTRRREASVGREAYLLFEDELTHETHLLRMGSISPLHRYRVFYLPHSGLAVGEPIADNVTFDPFGNPVEGDAVEPDSTKDESTVDVPDDTEDTPKVEEAPDTEDESETAAETAYHRPENGKPDPNSPERQKAAKMALGNKICRVVTYISCGGIFLFAVWAKTADISPAFFLIFVPFIVASLLSGYFKKQELKLRCTVRTTAHCIYTVRRRSGKHSHLHPVVEFEVDGEPRTAELSVSCTRSSVGELYTIYYDPLDPSTVRAE